MRHEDKALGVVYHGLAELAAFRESYYAIYPDLTVDTTFFTDGASVCLAWTASGTQSADRPGLPSTGKRMTIEGLSWLTVKDGKFTSSRDYWDRETAWRQLR